MWPLEHGLSSSKLWKALLSSRLAAEPWHYIIFICKNSHKRHIHCLLKNTVIVNVSISKWGFTSSGTEAFNDVTGARIQSGGRRADGPHQDLAESVRSPPAHDDGIYFLISGVFERRQPAQTEKCGVGFRFFSSLKTKCPHPLAFSRRSWCQFTLGSRYFFCYRHEDIRCNRW